MVSKLKRPIAFMAAVAMIFSMLLYLPSGTFRDIGFGFKASAEESTNYFTLAAVDGDPNGFENEEYTKLFDGDTGTKWCCNFSDSAYVIFKASEPVIVSKYSIATGNDTYDSPERNPVEWTLYGCMNYADANTSWTVIDTVTNGDLPRENEMYTDFDLVETTPFYQYFKLEITQIDSGNILQISEIALKDCTLCEHKWEKTDETIAPTCTEGGYDVYECSKCHATKNVPNDVPVTEHSWVNGDVVAPTCTEHGYTLQTCSVCGAKRETDIKDALGHNFVDGVCTRCDTYEISNADQLYWFAGLVNGTLDDVPQNKSANAVLTADIVVNENVLNESGTLNSGTFRSWTPIGNLSNKYTGTFDGQGHKISGLYFNNTDETNGKFVGLFGYVYNGGKILNVSVVDSYFSGYQYVSGVCGVNYGSISNCYNLGTVSGSDECVGGVCGVNYGSITNCYNAGKVSGGNYVGGVCGLNKGSITNCYNAGKVSGGNYVGGVCGYSTSGGTITNCYNTGSVTPKSSGYAGGVCGFNYGKITNCYNTGEVSGNNYCGGVCGYNWSGTITNCYNDSSKCSEAVQRNSGTATDVENKTTEEFASGEVAFLLQSGQTAVNGTIPEVWGQKIGTENYPVLGGDKVYKTTPCVSYSNENVTEKEHTDADDDGYCDNCGIIIDGIGAKLIGHSITLDGSIGVYFYMELSDEVVADNTAYMEFTLPNGKTSCVNVSSAETEEISGKTYYKFRCDVNAGEMTDKIKAQLKTTVGESKVYEYTVKEYADYLLEHKDENEEFAKASELIEAMLNYGSYAQVYANYNADNLAVGSAENLKNVDSVSINEYTYTPNENETNVKLAGANLSLLSRTTLRLFFAIENVDAENVTFTYGGNTLEKTKSGDYYYVEIAGISASMLDDNCVVNVNDGTNTFDVTYTPMAYCYNVVSRETTATRTQALKNLIKALALYNQAADAYINQ